VAMRPDGKRLDARSVGPGVLDRRAIVEDRNAGPIAHAKPTRLVRDVRGLDVCAVGLLEPRDDLEIVGRREIDIDGDAHALRPFGQCGGGHQGESHREPPPNMEPGQLAGPAGSPDIVREFVTPGA